MGIEELKRRRDEILRVAASHGARRVRVFGSVARGEADERSDVDFLVDLERGEASSTWEAFSWTSRICWAGPSTSSRRKD
jgi:predicted nucleotidyltransferase